MTLSSDLVITGQGVGVASRSSGFDGVDGILGIGPTDLTGKSSILSLKFSLNDVSSSLEGTVSGVSEVPTVTDNLFTQGTISEKVVGVYFAPTNSLETTNGELTFGGVDSSLITGSIAYTPITSTSPSSFYFGIDQSITYGSDSGSTVLSATAGIVDTGTTLVLIASDAFATYRSLTGAVEDNATGLLRISSANYANLQSLFFNVGGTSYEFTKNAQVCNCLMPFCDVITSFQLPRHGLELSTPPSVDQPAISTLSSQTYVFPSPAPTSFSYSPTLVTHICLTLQLGSNSGEGFDFINGYTFLERYYSVFDTTNNRVGFASTSETFSTIN